MVSKNNVLSSLYQTYGFGVAFTFILSDTNYKSDMRKCKCYNDDGAPKKSSASKDADKVSGNSSDKSADKSDQEKKPEEKKEEPKQETKEETKEEKTSETEASTKEEKSADEKVKEAAEKITAESAEADKEKAEKKPLMEIPQPELIKQDKVIPDFTFSNEDIVANISSIAPKMNTDPHNVEMITVLLLKIMNIITLEQMYHHLQKQDLEVVNSIYKFYTGSVLIPSVNTFGIEEACSLDFLIDMVNREQNYIMDIGNLSKENIDILERLKESGLNFESTKEEEVNYSDKLEGKAIVISGVFSHHSRDEYKDIIEKNGGKNVGSISGKTSFILAGDNMGPSKLEKAQKLGVPIVSEDEFLNMIE
jgi:BRCT domain type II-containing protein